MENPLINNKQMTTPMKYAGLRVMTKQEQAEWIQKVMDKLGSQNEEITNKQMNYELALKLKEAGFDFGSTSGELLYDKKTDSYLRAPSLSDLIEACGDDFVWLVKETSAEELGWSALSEKDFPHQPSGKGSTPEEAVANLWLALKANK
jgi:hypothetical protein